MISFFAGAGGLDAGFRAEGFEPVLALDSNAAAVASFNANDPTQPAVVCDLKRLSEKELFAMLAQRAPHATPRAVIGGPPCQSFSNGNVRKHRHDHRGALGYHYARLLAALNRRFKLDFFVFENVTGIRKKKHRRQYRKILNDLSGAGFNVTAAEMDASAFGVPQQRHRLLIVGINRRKYPWVKFTFPTGKKKSGRTVRDAIFGLPEPKYFQRGLTAGQIPFHPNHWTMMPKSSKFKTGDDSNEDGRSFRRLEWDKPSRTVAYGNREVHLHPTGHRRLSVLEAMLLQGFTADYKLSGTLSDQISQVSNAVPPPLAAALARAIKAQLYSPIEALQRRLGEWFAGNQRHYPWRQAKDPFHVLVAEKLLQQTAATPVVVAAYERLLHDYPDCHKLARAKLPKLGEILRPLGLLYRAAELIRLAQALRDRHQGRVPDNLQELLALPGVGDYSARAVLAFAYRQPVPIVDSNVARFLLRYFRLAGPKTPNPARNRALLDIAGAIVPRDMARAHNLAILDICAATCTAGLPRCDQCALRSQCGLGLFQQQLEPAETDKDTKGLSGKTAA